MYHYNRQIYWHHTLINAKQVNVEWSHFALYNVPLQFHVISYMKFISQMLNSTDKSLENEMQLLMLLSGWLVILHIFVHPNNICGGSSVHFYSEEQSYWMLFIGLDLLSSFWTKMWHIPNVWFSDLKATSHKQLFNSGCSEISSNLFKTFLIDSLPPVLMVKFTCFFVDPIKNSQKHLSHSLFKFSSKSLYFLWSYVFIFLTTLLLFDYVSVICAWLTERSVTLLPDDFYLRLTLYKSVWQRNQTPTRVKARPELTQLYSLTYPRYLSRYQSKIIPSSLALPSHTTRSVSI